MLFIDEKSRELSYAEALVIEKANKKRVEKLLEEEAVKREQDKELFHAIMKAEGLVSDGSEVICYSCGLRTSASGKCKC